MVEVKTKQRLVGGLVLVAIAAIFLPLLFHNSRPSTSKPLSLSTRVPKAPAKPQVTLELPLPSKNDGNISTPTQAANATSFDVGQLANVKSRVAHSVGDEIPTVSPKILSTARVAPAAVVAAVPVAETSSTKVTHKKALVVTKKKLTRSSKVVLIGEALKAWTLQVASFANAANADRLVKQLRAQGLDVYVRQSRLGHKTIKRVFVGPVVSRHKIEKIQRRLRVQHLNSVIRRYKL